MKQSENPFGDTKVEYPARVAMKVITYSSYSEEERESAITGVLELLELEVSNKKAKESNGGTYISHSFTTTIHSTAQLEKLYAKLRELEVVKMLL